MTPSASYLIKLAVTTTDLYRIAKANKIPLVGDWRYAAKLIHKLQKAETVPGVRHYERVLGFPTNPEKRLVRKALELAMNPDVRRRNHEYYAGFPPDIVTSKTKKLIEIGMFQTPSGRRATVLGNPEGVTTPSNILSSNEQVSFFDNISPFSRTLHTHPGKGVMKGSRDTPMLARNSDPRLGPAFFSGPLDRRTVAAEGYLNELSREHLRRRFEETTEAERVFNAVRKINTGEGIASNQMPYFRTEPTPKTLQGLIDAYKRRTSVVEPIADMHLLTTPVTSTHRVISPATGVEFVAKGSKGQLRRAYFRDTGRVL